jgi:LPS sulfotransferase NodH
MDRTSYFICTNPRSGSWLLSEGVTSSGLAGQPREWFQDEEEIERCASWQIERSAGNYFQAYLPRVLEEGTSPNGCFGCKVMHYQFMDLPRKLAMLNEEEANLSPAEAIHRVFPGLKYIWLRRRDSARQAISYYRASQTDRWWSIEGAQSVTRPGTTSTPEFDAAAVARLESEILRTDQAWLDYFAKNNVTPLTLFYEDLDADYQHTIISVLHWLGLTGSDPITIAAPRLKKQADAQTEDWLQKYKTFKSATAHPTFARPTPPPTPTPTNRQVTPTPGHARQKLEVDIFQIADDALFKKHRPSGTGWDWGNAPAQRDWMDQTQSRFAYRCLPLTIANQTGWWVCNPIGFTAEWEGNPGSGGITFRFDCEADVWSKLVNDQFGHGIITWNTPLLFRTRPAGSRLLIGGPVNQFKHGAAPMTAIMETDWTTASFTMNWKLTQPGLPVRFDQGEPLFQVIPLLCDPCHQFELAQVTYRKLADDPEVAAAYLRWSNSRDQFHQLKQAGAAKPDDWQKDYFRGRQSAEDRPVEGHVTKVNPPEVKFIAPDP